MSPKWEKPGTTGEQRGVVPHRDFSDEALAEDSRQIPTRRDIKTIPPASEAPHAKVAKHGKTWSVIGGMVLGALALVDVGVRIAGRNGEYATVGALDKQDKKIDVLLEKLIELSTAQAKINQKLDDQKATDLKPMAEQATKNALEAQAKAEVNAKEIAKIERGINGFNASASRRGQPTPIPLQDP